MRYVLLVLSFTLACSSSPANRLAPQTTRQPENGRLITSDIPNFYRAIDRAAASGGDTTAFAAAFRTEYLDRASEGLVDFVVIRLGSQAARAGFGKLGWNQDHGVQALRSPRDSPDHRLVDSLVVRPAMEAAASNLARTYLTRRSYYDAIRPNLMALDSTRSARSAIEAAFARMKALYPDATPTDVYFVVGVLSTGGTTFGSNLLIGSEMYGRDATTPLTQLADWQRSVVGEAKDLPNIVAHEYAHTQQGPRSGPETLLQQSLDEGGADFIAELISGAHIINPSYRYAEKHEAELWREFDAAKDSTKTDRWLYNGNNSKDRPADLGYVMGYLITKSYFEQASDKKAAVREILTFRDPKAFLAESHYGGPR